MKDELKKVKISDIKPYWRNPRVGNVDHVKLSIKEYGYNQYIVVDKDMVIIVGHTRYKALQELAVEYPEYREVLVLVSGLDEQKAKQYRIVDNQTGDQSEWVLDKLMQELREIGNDVAVQYFPAEQLDKLLKEGAGAIGYKPVEAVAVQKSSNELEGQMTKLDQARKQIAKKVICPNCSTEFEIA